MAALDIAIALTGVLVLAAAAFTTSMYLGRNEQNKQMEAVAAVGKNLEAIGMSGKDGPVGGRCRSAERLGGGF